MVTKKKSSVMSDKVPRGQCIAIIGDIIASRRLGSQRSAAQKKLFKVLKELNSNYKTAILSKFIVTAGDEFQVLLKKADLIPDLIWDMETNLNYDVRLGIGCGRLNTPLQPSAIGMDGPVWYAARAAIKESYMKKKYGGVFKQFGIEDDLILNGFARILQLHRAGITSKQLRILHLLRNGSSQTEVADRLRITRQAASQHARLAGWSSY